MIFAGPCLGCKRPITVRLTVQNTNQNTKQNDPWTRATLNALKKFNNNRELGKIRASEAEASCVSLK